MADVDLAYTTDRSIFITRQIRYFDDDYKKEDILGEGMFGVVYKAFRRSDSERTRPFAVKEIYKSRFTALSPTEKESLLNTMQNEISILLKLRHKNIVQLFDVYESRDRLNLVMEYLPGGELYDRICKLSESDEAVYGEKEAAEIMEQILDALNTVHSKRILHLDLKPENIIFADDTNQGVKLIDFGMSRMIPKLTLLKGKKIGTIQYMAPEMISGEGVGYAADIWSCGVILFCMIFGFPPFFYDEDDDEKQANTIGDMMNTETVIERKILRGFDPVVKEGFGAWFPKEMPISKECKKLITHMLKKEVTERWTVQECLSCKWIQQRHQLEKKQLSPLFRESLLKYKNLNKFTVAIGNLFTKYLDSDIKQEIIEYFNQMDTNHDGKVSLKEFEIGLKKINSEMSNEQIELLFETLDFDHDFSISLEELVTSSNLTALQMRDERLYAAFEKLDSNHDGKLSLEEMEGAAKEVLAEGQCGFTLERLKSAFDEIDENKDGFVDYDEFLRVLHPEFEDDDSWDTLKQQTSTLQTVNAPKFEIQKKSENANKHLILHPKSVSNDVPRPMEPDESDDMERLEQENKSLKSKLQQTTEQLESAQAIYRKNITKVHTLQHDLTEKDATIRTLQETLDERDQEIERLKETLKLLQQ